MNLFLLNGVRYTYLNNSDLPAFRLGEINLNIDKQEMISILGPNGSGKSTLLKIISGVLVPQFGEVLFMGNSITKYKRKEIAKHIGFVPAFSTSIYPFSVYEIVMMGRTPYLNFTGFEKKEDHEIVAEALNTVGIYELRNKGINEISGGEAQRAFIARALAQKPSVILLDEPTAHLDLKHQISVFKLLKELNENQDITIVIISHDLNLAGSFCNRAILMRNGKVVRDGKTIDMLTQENIQDVFEVSSEISTEIINGEAKVHVHLRTY
ncbi:putative siderophore transport system ATP-binding protein YusV [bacterium BMS3Abin04]|nr:putative siderophore transport system ATP-binding protein YusV [bacterium BMS3Abin04]